MCKSNQRHLEPTLEYETTLPSPTNFKEHIKMQSMHLYQTFSGIRPTPTPPSPPAHTPKTHPHPHHPPPPPTHTHTHTHTHTPSPSPSQGMSERTCLDINVESYKYAMFVSETKGILYI